MHKSLFIALVPLLAAPVLQGATIFDQNEVGDTLYTINDGSFDQSTGAFTRSGSDARQGVVASFDTVNLDNEGDYVEATFDWTANGNQEESITFGFFDGGAVSSDSDTATTDGWEGYFQSHYNRTGTKSGSHGVAYQGAGSNSLFNYAAGTLSASNVDGNHGTYGTVPGFNGGEDSSITLRLERLADDKLQLTTSFFAKIDAAESESGTLDGIDYTYDLLNTGYGTVTSTYDLGLADFGVTSISGIALARWKTQEWANDLTLNNLTVSAVPEPSAYAAIFGLAAFGFLISRRSRS